MGRMSRFDLALVQIVVVALSAGSGKCASGRLYGCKGFDSFHLNPVR
jgi:hypothetical protein